MDGPTASRERQPNILFIMADQMRADALGLENGWTRTPHLDRLAREGVRCRGVITNSAECVPARISLATGLYAHQTGVWENGLVTLRPTFPTWMQAVARAGYRTSFFGKAHLHAHEGDLRDRAPLMQAYGFDVVDETAGPHASAHVASHMTQSWTDAGLWDTYRDDVLDRVRTKRYVVRPSVLGFEHFYDVYVGRRAAAHLNDLTGDDPWLCCVSFGGPHEPWDAPEPFASLYDGIDPPAPAPRLAGHERVGGLLRRAFDSPLYSPALSAEDVRALRRNYAGKVTLIDEQIGILLDLLRARGDLARTVVIFTSDHGEMNGDQGLLYKSTFLRPVLDLPFIIRPPGDGAPGGGRVQDVVAELMDVGATMVDYAGGELPALSCARSLRPCAEGRAGSPRAVAVSEYLGHAAIADAHWKAEFTPDGEAVLLFDRQRDPAEQHNLVGDHARRAIVQRLADIRSDFLAATPPSPIAAVDAR